MAKNVGILAMDIYFPPTCVNQVKILHSLRLLIVVNISGLYLADENISISNLNCFRDM